MHELGHIQLEHTRLVIGQSRFAMSDLLIVNEGLSEFQLQEFEADAFVYSCLTDMGKKAFYAWTNYALSPTMMIEMMLPRTKDTHPLSINRLDRAYELSRDKDELTDELKSKEHLLRHSKAHLNIQSEHEVIRSMGHLPILEKWTRDDLIILLRSLSGLFSEVGIDIEPFVNSTHSGWRSLFV